MNSKSTAVIVAAYRAEDTIGRAVRSALRETQVAEVIVVDDASDDKTAAAAKAASGGDSRLKILVQTANAGPSAARNRAIAESTAPYIAILDSDDAFIEGRFSRFPVEEHWDFCADNILFTRSNELQPPASGGSSASGTSVKLDLSMFLRGNIPAAKKERGELGFVKPVMRRSFLERHGLSYREDCRLGEDFLFYAEALGKGATFMVIQACGYTALERPDSLSGSHTANDLAQLLRQSCILRDSFGDDPAQARAWRKYVSALDRRYRHRAVLDLKREQGLVPALGALFAHPHTAYAIFCDKIRRSAPEQTTERHLFSDDLFERRGAPPVVA